MPDRRSSGRDQRDTIIQAIERYHEDHNAWPTSGVLSKITGFPEPTLRHHGTRLFESGQLIRGAGSTWQIPRQDAPILPVAVLTLDDVLWRICHLLEVPDDGGVRVVEMQKQLSRQRSLISRRCAYMVSIGRMRRVGSGYRTVGPDVHPATEPETEK